MDIEDPDNNDSNKSEGIKKNEMDQQSSNQRGDIFEQMLELNISENQERADSDHHARTSRKNSKKIDFRKMLNSSSSNDRLIPPSLKYDSSRQNSERAHNYFQTENSQDQQSFHKSFKKRHEASFSIQNMAKDSSSQISERSWSRRSFHQILPPQYGQFKEQQSMADTQQKKVCCNCKRSKCLKLYCECFQRQLFCNQSCKCYDCGNHYQNNQQHKKAVIQALARNAHGFQDQNFENSQQKGFSLGVEIQEVKKGCKCRKTHCTKKYCECYSSGGLCGVFCRCEDCFNTPYHQNKKLQGIM